MAQFQKKKIDINSINGGNRYNVGDTPTPETFNAPIEASAYAQEKADEALTKASEALAKVNDSEIGEISLSAYPVGSIYLSVSSVSPASLFGGTWEQLKDRFLLACGDVYPNGAIGGSSTHTLTVAEMPSHSHALGIDSSNSAFLPNGKTPLAVINNGEERTQTGTFSDRIATSYGGEGYAIGYKGGGQPFDNMPPYLAVYMWKRIS